MTEIDNDEPQMVEKYDASAKEWFRPSDGKLHRIGAPAVIWLDGTEVWYKDGVIHNDNGPAYTTRDGEKNFYLFGEEVTPQQYQEWRGKHLEEQERRREQTLRELMEACEEATVLQKPMGVSRPLKLLKAAFSA